MGVSKLLSTQWCSWPCCNSGALSSPEAKQLSDERYRTTPWVLRVICIDWEFLIFLLSMVPLVQHCPGAKWHLVLPEEDMNSGRGCKAAVQVPHGKAVTSCSKHKFGSFSNPVFLCKTVLADEERPVIKLHAFFQTVLSKLLDHKHCHWAEVPAGHHSPPSSNS